MVPSRIIVVWFFTFSTSSPTPATAGMPRPRASIAVCEVEDPRAVQNPFTRLLSSRIVSEGVKSSATMTDASFRLELGDSATPKRMRNTRFPTSKISMARAAKYSSFMEAIISEKDLAVDCTATSAVACSSFILDLTAEINSGSSNIILWARKISASAFPASFKALW